MTAFLYRAPAGVVGDVTRPDDTVVEPGVLSATTPATAFGVAVKCVKSGTSTSVFVPMGTGDTAAAFYGILTRVAPSISGSLAHGFDDGVPNVAAVQGVAVKGYVCVKCASGTPTRGGAVYLRVTAATGKAVGDLEAEASGTASVALPGVTWAVDGADEGGLAEIRIG